MSSCRRQQHLVQHLASAAPAAGAGGQDNEKKVDDVWSVDDLPEPTTTEHSIPLGEDTLSYEATAGLLPIVLSEADGASGSMFFVAYTMDSTGDPATRPLTFCFNGGPGSASVWLHLGGLGPKRVALLNDGGMPPPPYHLVDNEHTWLPKTDLVFVDAMGTGFSRPKTQDDGAKFWGTAEDLDAFTEFIRCYIGKYRRWLSPLYLAGESYGTFRAAGLASQALQVAGIAFQGIMLISSVLSFQTLWDPISANQLPSLTFIPTYTATAWYHGALVPELQSQPLRLVLDEVEEWCLTVYASVLAKGEARLTAQERAEVVTALARYTGLSEEFIVASNLRVDDSKYRKELLRRPLKQGSATVEGESVGSPAALDGRRTVGRLDSRYIGVDKDAAGESMEFDPAMVATSPVFVACFNDYIVRELNYDSGGRRCK